jgi:hypothetical protein
MSSISPTPAPYSPGMKSRNMFVRHPLLTIGIAGISIRLGKRCLSFIAPKGIVKSLSKGNVNYQVQSMSHHKINKLFFDNFKNQHELKDNL